MEEWTRPYLRWDTKKRINFNDFLRIEKNIKHLKETPLEDFSLQGTVGTEKHSQRYLWIYGYPIASIIKQIPDNTELYIKNASRDTESGYLTMQLESYVHSTSSTLQAVWYNCPEIGIGTYNIWTGSNSSYGGNTRWSSPVYGEDPKPFDSWYYSDRGHLVMKNISGSSIIIVLTLKLKNLFGAEDPDIRPIVELNRNDKGYMQFHLRKIIPDREVVYIV